MWRYELADPTYTQPVVTLDNGVKYDLVKTQELINEKNAFLNQRRKSMQILKAPEPVVAKKGAVKTAPKKK